MYRGGSLVQDFFLNFTNFFSTFHSTTWQYLHVAVCDDDDGVDYYDEGEDDEEEEE